MLLYVSIVPERDGCMNGTMTQDAESLISWKCKLQCIINTGPEAQGYTTSLINKILLICDQILGKRSKSHISQNQTNTTSG